MIVWRLFFFVSVVSLNGNVFGRIIFPFLISFPVLVSFSFSLHSLFQTKKGGGTIRNDSLHSRQHRRRSTQQHLGVAKLESPSQVLLNEVLGDEARRARPGWRWVVENVVDLESTVGPRSESVEFLTKDCLGHWDMVYGGRVGGGGVEKSKIGLNLGGCFVRGVSQ